MKLLKKSLLVVGSIILGLILIYNIYNIFELKIMKKDLATVGGYGLLEVVSGSMEPTIKVGDLVIIDTKDKNYKKDDIITFYDEENHFVTHRIIEIKSDSVITQGDNNNTSDGEILKDKIVGKYVLKIAFIGTIMEALKSPITMIMILIIGIIVCYLVSTDKDGNPILTEDEKEFEEFIKNKEKK